MTSIRSGLVSRSMQISGFLLREERGSFGGRVSLPLAFSDASATV